MNRNQQLALLYKALDDQLKSARARMEETKRALRNWLKGMPQPNIGERIAGMVHVYLQLPEERTRVNQEAVEGTLRDLVRTQAISVVELQEMVASGVIGIRKPEEALVKIQSKLPGYQAPQVPLDPEVMLETAPMKFHVEAGGRFGGLQRVLRTHVDLDAMVTSALTGPGPEELLAATQQATPEGTVNIGARTGA